MPSFTTIERIERTEQRISELTAGKEVDAKHIAVLLNKERQQEFAAEWRRQQKLRLVKKPVALSEYEILHKQASAVLARCIASATRAKTDQATVFKLQTKCITTIERAQAEIAKQIKKRAALTEWLDREVAVMLPVIELDDANQKAIKLNNGVLNDGYERLPILITIKNHRRQVTQEQRFGWQTKRDIRLRLLRETLTELNANLVTELEREQHQREVRAARVFMDAYFKAGDEDKNAWAV